MNNIFKYSLRFSLNQISKCNTIDLQSKSLLISNCTSRFYSTKKTQQSKKEEHGEKIRSIKSPVDTPKLLSVSSFFRYPEGGVNEYANLSKGTAFLVSTPKTSVLKKQNRNIYCISCAHITHPFHFPNLYKEDQYGWIYVLGESNIKAQLEYRDTNGKLQHSIPLKPPFHLHPMLDLVVFRVNEEDFKTSKIPYQVSIIDLEDYDFPKPGDQGKLFGYQLVNEQDNIMKPIDIDCKLHFKESEDRYYLSTSDPSPMGVCGGPVINLENEVIGMVEGLAQIDPSIIEKIQDNNRKDFLKKVHGNTVFIPSQVLKDFISKIDSTVDLI